MFWSFEHAPATSLLVQDLANINVDEVLILVKWGKRENPVVDLVDRFILQAFERQELLPDYSR